MAGDVGPGSNDSVNSEWKGKVGARVLRNWKVAW